MSDTSAPLTEPPIGPAIDPSEPRVPQPRTALWITLIVGLVVAGLLAVLATRETAADRAVRSPILGTIAPDFSGRSLLPATDASDPADASFALTDANGKFVVLNFFASWCVPCALEHPELNAFHKAHRELGDAVLVSVVFQDEISDVRSFFARRGGSWPVLDSDRVAVDYGVTGVPETFLINPEGIVVAKWNGPVKKANVEDAMARARAASAAAPAVSPKGPNG